MVKQAGKISLFMITASLVGITTGTGIFTSKYLLLGEPKVTNVYPSSDDLAELDTKIIIKFSKPIKRQEVTHEIIPEVHGEWKFQSPILENHLYRELIFMPLVPLEPDTEYKVRVQNIKNHSGIQGKNVTFSFRTKKLDIPQTANLPEIKIETASKPSITLLDIPVDWQDDPLSCEAASLKMALVFKGAKVSEKDIMEKIGTDETPRKGNVWGDPHETYVGDIKGEICKTGYGVYWDPVAKAAMHWNAAEVKTNWNIEELAKEISLGNPVVVWGKIPGDTINDCSWFTSRGKYVKAYKEAHVRLVVGFVGRKENPEKIILNDPIAGRLYWDTS